MIEYIVEVHDNGNECWHNKKGELHREGGPAIKNANGFTAYYKNNRRHRVDGPAVIRPDGEKEYWLHGSKLTKEEFDARGNPKHEGQVVVVDGVEYELSAVTKGE